MTSSFRPKHLIQAVAGLALLTLTQCKKPEADALLGNTPTNSIPEAPVPTNPAPIAGGSSSNSIGLVSEGLSPAFRAVASRLELGGCSFEYSEAGGAPALVAFLDEVMKVIPAAERGEVPASFTFASLFKLLGLDAVAATGSSSRARADGSFHSRSFAYMPQGRKGLMTLSGGAPAKLLLLDVAPKDTDLALEFPLNLKDFARELLPGVLGFLPPTEKAKVEQEMPEPIPALGVSGKQMVEKLDARIGVFLRLDPAQKFKPAPDVPPVPGVDGVIVADRLGWLFEALKPQFMPGLEGPGSPVTVSNEGGVLTLRFKGPIGPPPMDFQPALRFDPKADRILIAFRPALFDSVVAGKEKITQAADFAQAWRDLPTEGNACLYASPRLLQAVGDLIATSAQSSGTAAAADRVVMGKAFDWIKPYLSRGQAVMLTNQPDGILFVANTSIQADPRSLSVISTVAVLAGFALPVFSSAQERGRETDDLSTMKQLAVALRLYASDHDGKYPSALSDLVKAGILPDAKMIEFTDRNTHQRQPWIYRNTLTDTSPATEFLLATLAASRSGRRVVAFADGSAKVITEAEFRELSGKR